MMVTELLITIRENTMYKLHIGNKNYSSWSLRPWLLMTELSIPFEERMNPFDSGSNYEKFRDFSPNGLVPCLQQQTQSNNFSIWDSLAIVEYLAEQYDNVWPTSEQARAWSRSATAEMHSGFRALRNQWTMNCGLRIKPNNITPELLTELKRIEELWTEGMSRFGGPFLGGDKFTAVDAFYAPVVFRFRTFGHFMPKNISDYYELILSLDSMQRWDAEAIKEIWREEGHEKEAVESGVILNDYR
jgi:glutathione S-transferase